MPPAIVAAVVAVGASAAGAFGVIALSTAMIIATTATVAGALLSKQSIPSIGNYTAQSERKQVLRSSAAPCTYIYGKTVVSGALFFAEEQAGAQDKDEWVHLALAIADHPVHSITKIWLGDDLIGTYGGYASYEVHIDRQTADPFMLRNCRSWKSTMVGKGITWLRVSLKFDQEKFPAGLPNIKCEVMGALVEDVRTGKKEWTDNAALIIRDVYKSKLMNVPDSDLNDDYFKQAANICDEVVTNPDGSTEKRYTINGVFDASESMVSILDDMHEACGGEPTLSGGEHGILVGAYYGPAIHDLNDDHIISDVNIIPETQYSDKVNIISGTFIDPKQGYVETDFPPIIKQDWIDADGAEFKQDLKLRFVTSEFTAQRLAGVVLNRKKLGRTIEFTANLYAYRLRTGFYVNLTLDKLGITNSEFRVVGWELSGDSGVKLTLRQETPQLWGDAIGKPLERPDLIDLPKGDVAAPTSLEYVTESIGDVVQGYLRWSNSGKIAYNSVQVFDEAGQLAFNINVPSSKVNINGLVSGLYTAQVVAYGVSGGKSAPAVIQIDVRSPEAPSSIRIESGFYSIGVYPTATSSGVTFEFWVSEVDLLETEVTTRATRLGSGNFWVVDNANPAKEYFFYVRTSSIYGSSKFAKMAGRASDKSDVILDIVGEKWMDSELGQMIKDLDTANLALESVIAQNKLDIELMNISIRKSFQEIGNVSFEIRQTLGDATAGIKRVEGAIATESDARAQSFEYLDAAFETNKAELNTFKDVYANDQYAMTEFVRQLKTQTDKNTGEINTVATSVSSLEGVVNKNQQTMYAQFETVDQRITSVNQKIDTTKTDLERSIAISTQNLQASINDTNAKVENKLEAVVRHDGTAAATYTLRAGITLPNGTYKSAGLFIGVDYKSGVPIASVGITADNFVVMNNRNGKLTPVFVIDEFGNVAINSLFVTSAVIENGVIGSILKSRDYNASTKKGIMLNFGVGHAEFNSVTINGGTLNAVDGTFSGTVDAANVLGDVYYTSESKLSGTPYNLNTSTPVFDSGWVDMIEISSETFNRLFDSGLKLSYSSWQAGTGIPYYYWNIYFGIRKNGSSSVTEIKRWNGRANPYGEVTFSELLAPIIVQATTRGGKDVIVARVTGTMEQGSNMGKVSAKLSYETTKRVELFKIGDTTIKGL